MKTTAVNPILNVSNIVESFAWFERLGWVKNFEWGDPVGFGSVGSGEVCIFLCENGQGGRGKGSNRSTFAEDGGVSADKGVWMSLWVDDVNEVHAEVVANNIEVLWGPEDTPWGVRELHIRHPDGHVFRIGTSIEETS